MEFDPTIRLDANFNNPTAGDIGRPVIVRLQQHQADLNLSILTARVLVTPPDRPTIPITAVNIRGTEISFIADADLLTSPGNYQVQVVLFNGDNRAHSEIVQLRIGPRLG